MHACMHEVAIPKSPYMIRARRENIIEVEITAIESGNSSPAPASIAGVGAMSCAITPQPQQPRPPRYEKVNHQIVP